MIQRNSLLYFFIANTIIVGKAEILLKPVSFVLLVTLNLLPKSIFFNNFPFASDVKLDFVGTSLLLDYKGLSHHWKHSGWGTFSLADCATQIHVAVLVLVSSG